MEAVIPNNTQLERRLTLPLLILYGLGVTVGAGIYVLVGASAARAGIYAPISFLLAACVVAFTGLSYSELSTRYPVSAGEAEYVQKGFNTQTLSLLTGLMVVASGVVSAAAVSIGAAAYLQVFIPVPQALLISVIVIFIGLVAVWGILESVTIAAFLTLIELAGLAMVVIYGIYSNPDILTRLPDLIPPPTAAIWSGILSASLLAFFAFVGFEDIVNVAEEIKTPKKNLPRGILLTLGIATFAYLLVVSVVVLSVPLAQLQGSAAPLQLVFKNADGSLSLIFSLIAILATLNGVLIQVIMASRVIYGLAKQKNLPHFLTNVNPVTHTPLTATILITALILGLAHFVPIGELAETTSSIVLVVFCLVNLALIKIKYRTPAAKNEFFTVPIWIPILGLMTCILLLMTRFLS